MVDQYVEGNLPAAERVQFEEYFLKSQVRQDKLSFARALKRRKATLRRATRLYRFYLPAAAAALLFIGLGVAFWRAFIYQSDVDKGVIALRSAFSRERPVDARLSALDYAPVGQQRGAEQVDAMQRDLAQGLLSYAAAKHPSAEAHHALGQYFLAERQFDRAIQQLKTALSLDPQNAEIHSDLGAALLEKGKHNLSATVQERGGDEFAQSLEHLNEALKLDDSLLGALFNRALLHQQMGLIREAEDDWRRYLEKETDARWLDEARRRLALLEEEKKKTSQSKEAILQQFLSASESGDDETAWRLVSNYHNRPGNLVVSPLLDAFLEQSANGNREAAGRSARLLKYAGELERQRAGDRFFSELARVYESATPEQRASLAEARGLMRRGHETWGQAKVEESLDFFSRAKQLFEQTGDVGEAKVAEYWMSFCHYRNNKQEQSLAILEPLAAFCEANGHVWLYVRCLYLRSSIHYLANEPSKAVDVALRSEELAGRTNDLVGMLNVVSALIEYYRYLGNYRKMLGYIQRSLPLVSSIPLDPVQGARHYGFVATGFASIGRHDAAAAYQREALRLALNTGSDAAIATNYAFLGMINGKLKNFGEALRHVRSAFDIAQARAGESAYRILMAYSSLQIGHIQREAGQVDEAIANYSRAIEIYEKFENFETHLYQAHKGRLLCYIAQGNDPLAAEEISETLKLVERYRTKIHEENNRNSFFDVEQSVYDAAIDFAYSRQHNPQQAFQYLESSRSRSLLDLLESDREVLFKVRDPDIVFSSVSQPLSLADIQQRMPERAQLLQYAVLENKILIWVISKSKISVVSQEVSQKELNEKVTGYVQMVSRAAEPEKEDALRGARDLFDILIRPVEALLDREKELCVIPDKVLNRLPFATLVSRSSGRYLIEDYLLLTSQSPTIFVLCSERAAQKEGDREETLLSVGNPRIDRTAYPTLPDLPLSAREAVKVASYYGASPLTENQASLPAVMSEITKADVLHFALHSALDEEVPLRSKLLLASAAQGASETASPDSALYAYEVYNLKLPQARLVVLSACQTGAERYYNGEGMSSLARPFISAGVPLVVASLWPVDSDATSELMIGFHRHRRRDGLSTAAALRAAQLEMLRGPVAHFHHPYYWAPFTLIGGYATF
ncbi:MAG TPA: CHAT domain-containing protein [Pyrinomonadaceae bacterium]|nr:CHAT domain-containing protein [Pyrinomonadaceae bacterium]